MSEQPELHCGNGHLAPDHTGPCRQCGDTRRAFAKALQTTTVGKVLEPTHRVFRDTGSPLSFVSDTPLPLKANLDLAILAAWTEVYPMPPQRPFGTAPITPAPEVPPPGATVPLSGRASGMGMAGSTMPAASPTSEDGENAKDKRRRGKPKQQRRTKIGKSVFRNSSTITVETVSIFLLIEEKLASLHAQEPNSDEAKHERDEKIANYEHLRMQVGEFRLAVELFVKGNIQEATVVKSTLTFAEGIKSWWTKSHHQICERAFDMALFCSAVGVCTLAGAGGPLSVSIPGAMVGGKPVVDVIKAVARSFAGKPSTTD
jgi:hypothetical protein